MNLKLSDHISVKPEPNVIRLSERLWQTIQLADKTEWRSLFNEFRLNLQNRIAGSDERELLKLQAKIEEVNEIEQFFDKIFTPPPK